MGRVINWIETHFSVMVRSRELHWMEARSYSGLVARVNLIRFRASNPKMNPWPATSSGVGSLSKWQR